MYELNDGEKPSETVIDAVAESTAQSPLEMEPLAEAIDPDALDRLLYTAEKTTSSTTIRFEYCGQEVTVTPSEVRVND